MSDDGTYELLPRGPGVPKGVPGVMVSCPDVFGVLDAAAAEIFLAAGGAVGSSGEFHLALSATPITTRLVRQLMIDPGMRAFPWKQTRVWLAEETTAGGASSAETFREMLLEHSGMARDHFHAFDAALPEEWEECGRRLAERVLSRSGSARLDCALLGLDGGWAGAAPSDDEAGAVYVSVPGLVRLAGGVVSGASMVALLGAGAKAKEAAESAARVARGEAKAARASDLLHLAKARVKWFVGEEGTEGNVNA